MRRGHLAGRHEASESKCKGKLSARCKRGDLQRLVTLHVIAFSTATVISREINRRLCVLGDHFIARFAAGSIKCPVQLRELAASYGNRENTDLYMNRLVCV